MQNRLVSAAGHRAKCERSPTQDIELQPVVNCLAGGSAHSDGTLNVLHITLTCLTSTSHCTLQQDVIAAAVCVTTVRLDGTVHTARHDRRTRQQASRNHCDTQSQS